MLTASFKPLLHVPWVHAMLILWGAEQSDWPCAHSLTVLHIMRMETCLVPSEAHDSLTS